MERTVLHKSCNSILLPVGACICTSDHGYGWGSTAHVGDHPVTHTLAPLRQILFPLEYISLHSEQILLPPKHILLLRLEQILFPPGRVLALLVTNFVPVCRVHACPAQPIANAGGRTSRWTQVGDRTGNMYSIRRTLCYLAGNRLYRIPPLGDGLFLL